MMNKLEERNLREWIRVIIESETLRSSPPQDGSVKVPGAAIDWDAADGEVKLPELRPWLGRPLGPRDMPQTIVSEPPAIGEDVEYQWQRWEDKGGNTIGVYEDPIGEATLLVNCGRWPETVHPPKRGVVQL